MLGLPGLLGLAPATSAGASSFQAGYAAPDQTLVRGCSWYRYSYWVQPGDNDWVLQIGIVDAGGVHQAFQFFTSGSPGDPTSGTARFQLCSANVHAPGRFSLVGELDLSNGSTQTATTLPTVHFTVKPAKAAVKHHKKKKKKRHHKKKRAAAVTRPH
ncbi:hypothetical protein [Nocardioides sp.]|uniref:hypothetical protein n=1 Tax=Nocardioides sp. TaxID=35761 RepID=UPI00262F4B13|nr:hypothetical protein [Nocardioides sp.]